MKLEDRSSREHLKRLRRKYRDLQEQHMDKKRKEILERMRKHKAGESDAL